MKLTRSQVKMVVVALAVGIALAGWVRTRDAPAVPCHAGRVEKRDAAGKVIEITTRTCLESKVK